MIGATIGWFLFAAPAEEVTILPSLISILLVVIVIAVVIVIVKQVKKNLTPKDKRGIESFGRPAKGDNNE